jgi:hypothetical protein
MSCLIFNIQRFGNGVRGSVVVKGTMLQVGSSRVQVPMRWIFNLPNPSGRTMALGSTQTLIEMITRNKKKIIIKKFGGKVSRCVGLTTLPPSISRLSK